MEIVEQTFQSFGFPGRHTTIETRATGRTLDLPPSYKEEPCRLVRQRTLLLSVGLCGSRIVPCLPRHVRRILPPIVRFLAGGAPTTVAFQG